jgi:hypothetical protein
MKTSWKVVICDLALVALVTLALAEDKPAKSVTPTLSDARVSKPGTSAPASTDFPVIGYIEKRGRTITIKSGPKGTLYSVKSADGKTSFENLSAEQLHAKAPDLDEFIESAVAGDPSRPTDARVRVQKIDAGLGAMR